MHDVDYPENVGQSLVCVETNNVGFYELPAVLGLTVVPVATYMTHTLLLDPQIRSSVVVDGIYVTEENIAVRENVDFFDMSKETLKLELAGGQCNW